MALCLREGRCVSRCSFSKREGKRPLTLFPTNASQVALSSHIIDSTHAGSAKPAASPCALLACTADLVLQLLAALGAGAAGARRLDARYPCLKRRIAAAAAGGAWKGVRHGVCVYLA